MLFQSNGYKPAPLDLSAVTLTPKMDELVDQLAENTHNLWARERIQQGWTYGLNEVGILPIKIRYAFLKGQSHGKQRQNKRCCLCCSNITE